MVGDWEAPTDIGELEAEYQITGELGRGGMAVVYLARDRALGRMVAIKVIRAKYVEDAEAMARFAREARTAAQLQHPNIVTLYAVRRLQSQGLALVMQYVPGLTLKALVHDKGPLPADQVIRVLRDVGAALTYAHRHGVIHRDVKPENIFIDEVSGRALLSDFGAALSTESRESALTLVGTAIGTPAYMSPEQIDGTEIDDRSDLYSLCLVGWEMLTGTRPWSGASLYSVIYRQKHEELPPADATRSDIPPAVLYAIEGGLCKDRAERWRTVEEFVSKLSASGAEVRKWKRRRRRTPALAGTAAEEVPTEVDDLPTVAYRRLSGEYAVAPAAAAPAPPAPAVAARPRRARRTVAAAAAALAVVATAGGMLWARQRVDRPAARQPARVATTRDAPAATPVPIKPTRPAANRPSPADPFAGAGEMPLDSVVWFGAIPGDTGPLADSPKLGPVDLAVSSSRPPGGRRRSEASGSASTRDAAAPPAVAPESRQSPRLTERAATPAVPPTVTAARKTPAVSSPADSAAGLEPLAPPLAPPPPTGPPPDAPPLVKASNAVLAGGEHSCLLTTGGDVYCWGRNDRGQIGAPGRATAPVHVGESLQFASLSLGKSHTCAVARSGALYCWGANDRGQLGDEGTADRDLPTPVAGGRTFRAVSAALAHSCAVSADGEAYCWGANDAGQLGDRSKADRNSPSRVAGGIRFTALTTGWRHSCALDSGGRAYCWGGNGDGQLGVGSAGDRIVPSAVAGDLRFVRIAAGSAHTCGLTQGGDVYCWGRNTYGQLGTGSTTGSLSPVRVQSTERFAALSAGLGHTCALTWAGEARCWGRNSYGQLGDGSATDRSQPVPVVGGNVFTRLDADGAHTCGALRGGGGVCWGYNVEGQLGDGTRENRRRPVAVTRPT